MTRRPIPILLLFALATAAPAQVATFQEGEAIVGIAIQNDAQKFNGLKLSPVGINIGFIVQPLFGSRRFAIVDQLSFFPIVFYERRSGPFAAPTAAPDNPLVLNTLWARWSSDEPEVEGKNVFFAGGGLSFAVLTPRDGHKMAPVLSVGARRWLRRQRGIEVGLQCGGLRIGRTTCVLPITTVWPFG